MTKRVCRQVSMGQRWRNQSNDVTLLLKNKLYLASRYTHGVTTNQYWYLIMQCLKSYIFHLASDEPFESAMTFCKTKTAISACLLPPSDWMMLTTSDSEGVLLSNRVAARIRVTVEYCLLPSWKMLLRALLTWNEGNKRRTLSWEGLGHSSYFHLRVSQSDYYVSLQVCGVLFKLHGQFIFVAPSNNGLQGAVHNLQPIKPGTQADRVKPLQLTTSVPGSFTRIT